ncbi:hypothetical protein DFP72DRAFT_852673 [Ephemerocybe angulata]|uniref:Uncharacterized protein n=1 Tax=Ephemerocybe angulata TaxID=980116 RepID=A0A8H6HLI9_9AGAR|nr:hypothetical protein DFP72DRAFT_852666 [Tulosesus angulatus]KAF6749233.1 hypothetical protein DFP72DRAFT_852670 [Tulosesus angulatus]KAF6749236.1 hypothetical protein DFP72DRAFT_852673 [Tulosesus angulatus]
MASEDRCCRRDITRHISLKATDLRLGSKIDGDCGRALRASNGIFLLVSRESHSFPHRIQAHRISLAARIYLRVGGVSAQVLRALVDCFEGTRCTQLGSKFKLQAPDKLTKDCPRTDKGHPPVTPRTQSKRQAPRSQDKYSQLGDVKGRARRKRNIGEPLVRFVCRLALADADLNAWLVHLHPGRQAHVADIAISGICLFIQLEAKTTFHDSVSTQWLSISSTHHDSLSSILRDDYVRALSALRIAPSPAPDMSSEWRQGIVGSIHRSVRTPPSRHGENRASFVMAYRDPDCLRSSTIFECRRAISARGFMLTQFTDFRISTSDFGGTFVLTQFPTAPLTSPELGISILEYIL